MSILSNPVTCIPATAIAGSTAEGLERLRLQAKRALTRELRALVRAERTGDDNDAEQAMHLGDIADASVGIFRASYLGAAA